MARNTTITDEQILEAARAVFLEEGFGGQTAKIAQRAGVSEGSIFKRFSTKEALFFAALQINPSPDWHRQLERMAEGEPGREEYIALFAGILLYFNEILPCIIAAMGNGNRLPPARHFEGMDEPPPVRDRRLLAAFLQREMEAGRLRVGNVEFWAALILGSLKEHIFSVMIQGRELTCEDAYKIGEGTFDLIWNGLHPDYRGNAR